jgi:hypothetical protein
MSYRPIEIADRVAKPRNVGPQPDLEWLPLSKLVIDNDFQRPLARANWTTIQKIADAFNWSHFTPVVVAPVGDGRFSVIDGQHRSHAARLIGATDVPCMIVQLTVSQQADAFATINGQVTAVTPYHIYRAALVARAPWAIACQQVVADANARLMTFNKSSREKKPGEVYCVSLIRKHVEAGRGGMVTSVLKSLWAAPNFEDALTWSATTLSPLLFVIQEHPRAHRHDLAPFIAANDPLKVQRKVDRMMASDQYRGKSRVVLMQGIWKALLNKWLVEGAS